MKPTKFLTNSIAMANQLNKRCRRDHTHQQLVSGRCKDASYYPAPLVRAILKGIALQAEEDRRSVMAIQESDDLLGKICSIPMPSPKPVTPVPWGANTYSSVPRMRGGSVPITYQEHNFRERYLDEYTGELLPKHLIRAAIEDELNYFNSKVWKLRSIDEMMKVPDHVLVSSRWVMCNKGDAVTPDCRARLVSCEINRNGKVGAFAASTPPLEAKNILFAKFGSSRRKTNKLRLSFVDIRKAYFNAIPEFAIYMKIPKDLGLSSDLVARQVRCVYGTRHAGKLWEDTYTQALEHSGFTTGMANPCVFYHRVKDITIVAHGDDFTALGTDDDLDWYEKARQESFEIKLRGRLGEGCSGPQEIRILNRVVSVDSNGLTYEADPRHGDLLMSSLNLNLSNSSATPGVKPHDRDDLAIKENEPETPLPDYSNPDSAIAAICAGQVQPVHSSQSSHSVRSSQS